MASTALRFGTGNVQDPYRGAQQALNNIGNIMKQGNDITARKRAEEESARRFGLQDARAQTTFNDQQEELARVKKQRGLINSRLSGPDVFGDGATKYIDDTYVKLLEADKAGKLQPGEYDTALKELNALAVGSYDNRVENPLSTIKQRGASLQQSLVNDGVDFGAATQAATQYQQFATPTATDNKDLVTASGKILDTRRAAGVANAKASKTASTRAKNTAKLNVNYNNQVGALSREYIDSDYTFSDKGRGGDFAKALAVGGLPDDIQLSILKSVNPAEDGFFSGVKFDTVVGDRIKEYVGSNEARVYEAYINSTNTKDRMTQNELADAISIARKVDGGASGNGGGGGGFTKYDPTADINAYRAQIAAAQSPSETDRRIGKSDRELAFGSNAPAVDAIFKRIEGNSSTPKPTTSKPPKPARSYKAYKDAPSLLKAIKGPKNDHATANMVLNSPKVFEAEYNSLGSAEQRNIDNILAGDAKYLRDAQPAVKPVEGTTGTATVEGTDAAASDIAAIQETLATTPKFIVGTNNRGRTGVRIPNPAYTKAQSEVTELQAELRKQSRPVRVKADNRALAAVSQLEVDNYTEAQLIKILEQEGISSNNRRKFSRGLL